jgi:phosphonate degradation associated HDIG domain protein
MNHEMVPRIAALFTRFGANAYEGSRRESVSALAHALQCAQLAEWADAPSTLVAAALLHDIGHFVDGLVDDESSDDRHERRALPWLSSAFGPEVTEPIRLHVVAKRYLVTVEPGYRDGLSPASIHSLALQGGDLDAAGRAAFEAEPFAAEAIALRRWDDSAKHIGKTTPSLDYYLALLEALCEGPQGPRTAISAFDLS